MHCMCLSLKIHYSNLWSSAGMFSFECECCYMCCGVIRLFEPSNLLDDYRGCGQSEFIIAKTSGVQVSHKLLNVIYLKYN